MARSVPELDAARAAGATRYFTGKPCRRGHVAERTVGASTCVECAKLSPANSAAKNSERGRKWRELNAEHKKQKWREWKANNPQSVKESAARYGKNNRAVCSARNAAWREGNPERAKQMRRVWIEQNRATLASQRAQRRTMQKQAAVKWANKEKVAEFYAEAARLTQETGVRYEVDHIDPIVHSLVCGLHNEFNLRVVTASENRRKSNRFTPGPPNDG